MAYNLEDSAQLETFLRGETREITIPGGGHRMKYDASQRIGVGISRLGTTEAVALGAYILALKRLDELKGK